MAIPLYVPEEYGPVSHSSRQPAANCASFVHQLILELYSIYQECSSEGTMAETSASNVNQANLLIRDINNNSPTSEFSTIRSRRRRHPAGSHQIQSQYNDMAPLPSDSLVPMAQSPAPTDLNDHVRHQRSELECKASLETNFGRIGLQLRQIADSYSLKANHGHRNCLEANAQKSKLGPSINYKIKSWHGKLAVVSSLLLLSISATAVLIRIK